MPTLPDAPPGFFLLLLGACFVVLAGGMGIASIDAQRQAQRSLDWPTVQGEVTTFQYRTVARDQQAIQNDPGPANAVERSKRILDWEYTYTVDGTVYTNRRDDWDDEDRRSLHALGAEVTVYYDPDDPSNAVLDPDTEPFGGIGSVLIPLALGGYLVYGGMEKRKRATAA